VKHIKRTDVPGTWSVCGRGTPEDTFVEAAMQSDCDDCRVHPSINVGRVNDVRWDGRGKLGVQKELAEYEPAPNEIKTREQEMLERDRQTGRSTSWVDRPPIQKQSNVKRRSTK